MSDIGLLLNLILITLGAVSASPVGTPERIYLRVTVTMTDSQGERLVPGLEEKDFTVLRRGTPQLIDHFSFTPSPSSVVILLDMDGSMQSIDLKTSVEHLLKICNARSVPDEVSLIAFAERPTVIKSFQWKVTDVDFEEMCKSLEGHDRYGEHGLIAAVDLARKSLEENASNYNQALVLVTDAEEDLDRSAASRMRSQLEAMGVRIYGIFFPGKHRLDLGRLHRLTMFTGGRYFRIRDLAPLELLVGWVLHELRYEYVIGFVPNSPLPEEVAGEISVELCNPRLMPGMSVRFTPVEAVGRVSKRHPEE